MNEFIYGAFTMGSVAVALFFLRYWRRSHDRLFAVLALAFLLLAVERIVLVSVALEHEGRHLIFIARLLAFVLIILGFVDKNRPQRRRTQES